MIPTHEEVHGKKEGEKSATGNLEKDVAALDRFVRTTPHAAEGGGKVRYTNSIAFDEIQSERKGGR